MPDPDLQGIYKRTDRLPGIGGAPDIGQGDGDPAPEHPEARRLAVVYQRWSGPEGLASAQQAETSRQAATEADGAALEAPPPLDASPETPEKTVVPATDYVEYDFADVLKTMAAFEGTFDRKNCSQCRDAAEAVRAGEPTTPAQEWHLLTCVSASLYARGMDNPIPERERAAFRSDRLIDDDRVDACA